MRWGDPWRPGNQAPVPWQLLGPCGHRGLAQGCWETASPSWPGPALWSVGWAHPQALAGGPTPPQQLDPENTGFIGADTFTGLVHSHELPLDPAKLDMLVALAQSNDRGQVCYQELVDLVSATVGGQQGRGPRPWLVQCPGWSWVGRWPFFSALPTGAGP